MEPNRNVQNSMQTSAAGVNSVAAGANVAASASAEPEAPKENMMAQGVSDKKSGKGMLIGLILCLLLAAGGICFGVWAMMDGNTQKDNYEKQISTLKTQITELQDKLSGKTEVDETVIVDDGGEGATATNTADYVYVGEWGLKIKIPDELKRVSYNYLGGVDVYGHLYVSGVYGESDELPDFANTAVHALGLGVVSRYTLDANSAENSSVYLGELVFNDDEYNYYYSGPQAYYSVDENEKQLEISSIGLVKQMLSDKNNYSKI